MTKRTKTKQAKTFPKAFKLSFPWSALFMQMNHVKMEEALFSCTSQLTHYAIAIKQCKNDTFLGY